MARIDSSPRPVPSLVPGVAPALPPRSGANPSAPARETDRLESGPPQPGVRGGGSGPASGMEPPRSAGASARQGGTGSPIKRAEAVRLDQELRSLSERRAWAGVERTFRRRLDLAQSQPLGAQAWQAGIAAARHAGNFQAEATRLRGALEGQLPEADRTQLEGRLQKLDSTLGSLDIRLPRRAEVRGISRSPVDFAFSTVSGRIPEQFSGGRFRGALPAGEYTLTYEHRGATHTATFVVEAGGQHEVRPSARRP